MARQGQRSGKHAAVSGRSGGGGGCAGGQAGLGGVHGHCGGWRGCVTSCVPSEAPRVEGDGKSSEQQCAIADGMPASMSCVRWHATRGAPLAVCVACVVVCSCCAVDVVGSASGGEEHMCSGGSAMCALSCQCVRVLHGCRGYVEESVGCAGPSGRMQRSTGV